MLNWDRTRRAGREQGVWLPEKSYEVRVDLVLAFKGYQKRLRVAFKSVVDDGAAGVEEGGLELPENEGKGVLGRRRNRRGGLFGKEGRLPGRGLLLVHSRHRTTPRQLPISFEVAIKNRKGHRHWLGDFGGPSEGRPATPQTPNLLPDFPGEVVFAAQLTCCGGGPAAPWPGSGRASAPRRPSHSLPAAAAAPRVP